jgi:hypothetical protein
MSSLELTNEPRICVQTVSDVGEATPVDVDATKALHRINLSKILIVNTLETISRQKSSSSNAGSSDKSRGPTEIAGQMQIVEIQAMCGFIDTKHRFEDQVGITTRMPE